MIALLEHINQVLSTIGTTYHPDVPQGASFPYIQFGVPSANEDYQREIFVLEVDVWDNQTDTTRLEDLADAVDKALHRHKHFERGVLQTSIYRTIRLQIPDPNEHIHRRQLRFECKTYIQ